MILYGTILITQILQGLFRAWNIQCLSKGQRIKAHLAFALYGITWLVAISLGLKSVADYDFIGISVWIIGGIIGQDIAIKMNTKRQ